MNPFPSLNSTVHWMFCPRWWVWSQPRWKVDPNWNKSGSFSEKSLPYSPSGLLISLLTVVGAKHRSVPTLYCCLPFCNWCFLIKYRTKCLVCCTTRPHYFFLYIASAVEERQTPLPLLCVPPTGVVWQAQCVTVMDYFLPVRDEVSLQNTLLWMGFVTPKRYW